MDRGLDYRKYEHTSLFIFLYYSLPFPLILLPGVMKRSDKLDPIDIHCMNFILSFLPSVRWPLWSRSLILRLDSESAYKRVRKTFSQFCVIHQHQWPESRSMKKSPGLRTRWTWTVDTHGHSALNMIWFDQRGARTTQHTQTDTKCTRFLVG